MCFRYGQGNGQDYGLREPIFGLKSNFLLPNECKWYKLITFQVIGTKKLNSYQSIIGFAMYFVFQGNTFGGTLHVQVQQ